MKSEPKEGIPDELIFLFDNDVRENPKKPNKTGTITIDGERKQIALWQKTSKKHAGKVNNLDRRVYCKAELYVCKTSEAKSILKLMQLPGSPDVCYILNSVTKNNKTYLRGVTKPIPPRPNTN